MSLAAGALTPEGWRLYHSGGVTSSDSAVSAVGFDDSSWHHVTVPSTVLNALVCDGVYPDPRVGMNNYLIPDVSDEFNARLGLDKYNHLADGSNPWQQPWWYRVEFKVPSAWRGKLVWLNLDGINYRADVWVNGHRVADRDSVVGMFRRFRFDVTPYIKPGRDNAVAIKIYQVDHPGDPSPGTQFTLFGPNRG
ncbi:MAG: glycoside hydrolase family 2, partial [Muribaculaceae bacterium]|nr:glycoside hydrolase family 2 [Muribaculaceae bacterium]